MMASKSSAVQAIATWQCTGLKPVSHTPAPTQDDVLQRGEAAQMGNVAVCHPLAPTQLNMLQRGEAAQVGQAPACYPLAATQVKVLQLG
jgi:hypothetical protein